MMLPNFFILGSAKCGTTALYEVLRHHPDIYLPVEKEPQFFCNDDLFNKGINYYSKEFFSESEGYMAVGESTPHYIYYEKVAKRISKNIPEDKQRFIIILRNPVKRAYSLYWNMVKEGHEELDFVSALDAEDDRLKDPMLEKTCTLKYSYLYSGLYAKQIDIFFKYFTKDKFLILFHDDLIASPENVYNQIFNFLGVPKIDTQKLAKVTHNAASMPIFRRLHMYLIGSSRTKKILGKLLPRRFKYLLVVKLINFNMKNVKYPKICHELENDLKKSFTSDICRLEKITGRILDHWK